MQTCCAMLFVFLSQTEECVLSGCVLHLFDVFLEHIILNRLYLSCVTEPWDSSSSFLRHYNFREVLAFSTNSFHLGRFLMQSLQFVILKALQLQGSFGLLNEFFPFGPVSDAVPPVCYFHICYVTFYIILPPIFRSS